MNKVILGGTVDRVESKSVGENNSSLLTFTIITTSTYSRAGEIVESNQYHRCQVWGKKADEYAATISDGEYAVVTGTLKNRSYEQDGVTKWVTQVDIDDLDMPGIELATGSDNGTATIDATDNLPF